SPKDITAIVAFPLPDLDAEGLEGIQFPTKDPINFVGFQTTVNHQAIEMHAKQRALVGKRDITAELNALGVPVTGDIWPSPAADWTPAQLSALKKLGAVANDGLYSEHPPDWTVRTRFWWQQRFPAHQTTVIDQSYQPITGGAYVPADFGIFPDLLAYSQVKGRCLGVFAGSSVQHLVATRRQAAGLAPGQE